MKTTFIYALCEPGTRTVRYIGKADSLKKRFKQHQNDSIKALTHLGNWLRLLAARKEKPDLIVLREVPFEQWEIAEERYIRLARGCGMNLVNSTDGGDGITMTPEIRAKISASKMGPLHPMFGKAPWNLGKKGGTPWNLGKITPPEVREKQSAAKRGKRPHNFGKPTPPEVCARQSAAAKERWAAASPEDKAKVSETARNISPETRARMSASQKLRFEREKLAKEKI